jgi:ribosomal protein S18 acetylase RimI-like enzyme
MTSALLRQIDAYLDAAPRAAARVEDLGGLRLFIKTEAEGWPYYARPIPGGPPPDADDVARVRTRQRALGLPESIEWVVGTTPGFAEVAVASGLRVAVHPLLVLEREGLRPATPPSDVTVRIGGPRDDHARMAAVAMAAFSRPGTGPGGDPDDDVERYLAELTAEHVAFQRRRAERGLTVPALATTRDGSIVGVGFHQPVGALSEVVGVATLPSARRRGIGAAITATLAADAFARGVDTVLLTAGDDEIARVYERIGFGRSGEAGSAEPG